MRYLNLCSISFPLPLVLAALFVMGGVSQTARGQSLADFGEFYLSMRINGMERLVFCRPTEAPAKESEAFGVRRDTNGNPVEVMRFFFGNPHTRKGWTIMRITYLTSDSVGTILERRTFHTANGAPMEVGYAFGEEILYRKNGEIVRQRLLDRNDDLLGKVPIVSQSRFMYLESGLIEREWRFASGKMHWGTNGDGPMRPYGPIPEGGYFRRYKVDERGELLYEELRDFGKKPFRFAGGEFARAYELNDCGEAIRVRFLDPAGKPMTDSMGVAGLTYSYDDHGRLVEVVSIDAQGTPTEGSDGIARVTRTFHTFDGSLVSEQAYDVQGNVVEPR